MVNQSMKSPSRLPSPIPESCQPFSSTEAVYKLPASSPCMISSVKVSMPQSVWWMTNHSRVASNLQEMNVIGDFGKIKPGLRLLAAKS